tara:strand:+ start:862 stop:2445 length:1584 start_codon:yes stop_codon:yes gene_type:complete
MKNYTQTTNLEAGSNKYSFSKSSGYHDVLDFTQELDNGAVPDGGSSEFYQLVELGTTKGRNKLQGAKTICIHNEGNAAAEISIRTQLYDATADTEKTGTIASTESGTEVVWWTTLNTILPPGDHFVLPSNKFVSYTRDNSSDPGAVTSAANHTQISDTLVSSLTDYDSGKVGVDIGTDLNGTHDGVVTTIAVGDGDLFMVGDFFRIDNEVMEVTAVSGNNLTVKRAQLGSAAASHTNTSNIYLFLGNHLVEFNDHTIVQTDKYGAYKGSSFFGQGRNSAGDTTAANIDGIVPGSIAIRFYTAGAFQECGLTGKTLAESTGLTASTQYYFKITQDGGVQQELNITTGTSVTYSSVLKLIQTAINDNSVLDVSVGLINGDVRFTSNTNKSSSAIALDAGTTGTNLFSQGDFNVTQDTARVADVQDDTTRDFKNITKTITEEYLFDDGRGALTRANGGSGSVNYETGEISFDGCPPNAEMKISVNVGSALAGGDAEISESTGAQGNIVDRIYARSLNPKVNTTIRTLVFY